MISEGITFCMAALRGGAIVPKGSSVPSITGAMNASVTEDTFTDSCTFLTDDLQTSCLKHSLNLSFGFIFFPLESLAVHGRLTQMKRKSSVENCVWGCVFCRHYFRIYEL